MHATSLKGMTRWMMVGGFLATAASAVLTAKFGWARGHDGVESGAYAIMLSLATFGVGYALVAAYIAARYKMYLISIAAGVLFTLCGGMEFLSHTGINAASIDMISKNASVHQAAFNDGRAAVTQADDELASLKAEREKMTPSRSLPAAQAIIANAEAHKFWKITDSCKATKGNQTRKFCDAYFSAQSDVKMWADRVPLEVKIAEATGRADKARAASSDTKLIMNAGVSQEEFFSEVYNGSLAPSKENNFWARVSLVTYIALYAVALGCLLNLIGFALALYGESDTRSPASKSTRGEATPVAMNTPASDDDGVVIMSNPITRERQGRPVYRLQVAA